MKSIYFAENLKILRKKYNMSQAKLAEQLGVSQRSVSDWENKVCEPSFAILAKLCEIFDETFDDILT